MRCARVREHLLDALDGALDPALASAVQDHLRGCPACRRELEETREMWTLLGGLEAARPAERSRTRFQARPTLHEPGEAPGGKVGRSSGSGRLGVGWLSRPSIQAALAMAALALGVGLGMALGGRAQAREARELRGEMRTMMDVVAHSLLEHQSASERLRAVSLLQESQPDHRLVEALLRTIRADPSVNVRLAALDVLADLTRRTDVSSGLLEAFPSQESPAMQVALGEVLLAVDGEGSRREIRRALDEGTVPEGARTYLLEVLGEGGLNP